MTWSKGFEPQLGPLPQSWPSLDEINTARVYGGLAAIPTNIDLDEVALGYGFTDCAGIFYRRCSVATSEAEVLVA